MFDKIYRNAIEKEYGTVDSKDVRNYVVYASEGILYYESAYTTKVAAADIADAFLKGSIVIVDSDGVMMTATAYNPTDYTVSAASDGGVESFAIAETAADDSSSTET